MTPPTTFEPGTPPPTTFEPGTPPPSESLPGFVFEGIKKEAQKNQVLFESSIQDFNSLNDSMNSQIETLRKIKLEISATATTGSP